MRLSDGKCSENVFYLVLHKKLSVVLKIAVSLQSSAATLNSQSKNSRSSINFNRAIRGVDLGQRLLSAGVLAFPLETITLKSYHCKERLLAWVTTPAFHLKHLVLDSINQTFRDFTLTFSSN